MAIIGPKPWVNAFQKCQCLDFLNILFLQPRKAFFVLEYRKRDCPGLYCPKKKKLEKTAIFKPKPWVNHFRKITFLRYFEILVFTPQKGVFPFQNIVKDIYLAYITFKKVVKMTIFGPKPWFNLFTKMSIFRLFDLLVFKGQKSVVFVLEYHKSHFPALY